MKIKQIMVLLMVFLLALGTAQAETAFTDEELKAMILQPEYVIAFYNAIVTEYMFTSESITPAQEKLWCLAYNGEITGMCFQYVNGYGNLTLDFFYDESGKINMLIAQAYPTEDTNKTRALDPLFMTIAVLLDDFALLEWTSNITDSVDMYYADNYEVGYFHMEEYDSLAIVPASTDLQ